MEQFKKRIGNRIRKFSILTFLTALVGIYDVFMAPDVWKESVTFHFLVGVSTAVSILSSCNILRYSRILDDENKLKHLYNVEKDERYKIIKMKAGIPIIPIFSVLMILAGLITSYFNILSFTTLLIVAFCMVFISSIMKIVYLKRM